MSLLQVIKNRKETPLFFESSDLMEFDTLQQQQHVPLDTQSL